MKHAIIVLSLCYCFSALAADSGAKPNDISQRKQELIQNLDTQISSLQNAKACYSAAQDHEAMKKCHQDMASARKDLRKQKIDEKIKNLQEQKAKIQD